MLGRATSLAERIAACRTAADFGALRAECTDAVVASSSPRRVIVAGPGTGKTFLFERVLKAYGRKGLVLTFLAGLVGDLRLRLSECAEVSTFHAFCKRWLHLLKGAGLGSEFLYYPLLFKLLEADFCILGYDKSTGIERAFYDLDDSESVITNAIRLGKYYSAVSHTDCVFRVLRHLEKNRRQIQRYPVVVVDEYQDFNALETRFIEVLGWRSPLLIAGDDDQALYVFKRARPDAIRGLACSDTCERFELPFCSRCTAVMVQAANTVVLEANKRGLLKNRVSKLYYPYPPDKDSDSRTYPTLADARCSVQNKRAPYMGKYVARAIGRIPEAHVDDAKAKGEPTVLVIGPKQFISQVHEYLAANGVASILKTSTPAEVVPLDGLRFLASDPESRLGWRVTLHVDPVDDCEELIGRVLSDTTELADSLPASYRRSKLRLAQAVSTLLRGEPLGPRATTELESTVGMPVCDVVTALRSERDEDTMADEEPPPDDGPQVVCTSFQGAKGLAAQHVFIVGMNDGHFPYRPSDPSELETCEFIVALTRGRRQCHLVSCGNFAGKWCDPSIFLQWVAPYTETITANKDYFA